MLDPFALPHLYPIVAPPGPKADWALFLDLDGTLLDIAATPDRVVVPNSLVHDLVAASGALRGAIAIVSGRPLAEVDALLNPLRMAGAGEHGAVVRLPDGRRDEIEVTVPAEWVDVLVAAVARERGVLLERKAHSVAVHYRQAPRHGDFFRTVCFDLIAGHETRFEVLQGRMVFEIRPRSVNKGRAVDLLMESEPFRGRRPVFVGDDVTDEDGFRAAARHGGEGLDVFIGFAGRPAEVRRWLRSFAAL
jgi:trehalose 6-phosphate phosphatase